MWLSTIILVKKAVRHSGSSSGTKVDQELRVDIIIPWSSTWFCQLQSVVKGRGESMMCWLHILSSLISDLALEFIISRGFSNFDQVGCYSIWSYRFVVILGGFGLLRVDGSRPSSYCWNAWSPVLKLIPPTDVSGLHPVTLLGDQPRLDHLTPNIVTESLALCVQTWCIGGAKTLWDGLVCSFTRALVKRRYAPSMKTMMTGFRGMDRSVASLNLAQFAFMKFHLHLSMAKNAQGCRSGFKRILKQDLRKCRFQQQNSG